MTLTIVLPECVPSSNSLVVSMISSKQISLAIVFSIISVVNHSVIISHSCTYSLDDNCTESIPNMVNPLKIDDKEQVENAITLAFQHREMQPP